MGRSEKGVACRLSENPMKRQGSWFNIYTMYTPFHIPSSLPIPNIPTPILQCTKEFLRGRIRKQTHATATTATILYSLLLLSFKISSLDFPITNHCPKEKSQIFFSLFFLYFFFSLSLCAFLLDNLSKILCLSPFHSLSLFSLKLSFLSLKYPSCLYPIHIHTYRIYRVHFYTYYIYRVLYIYVSSPLTR